MAILRPFCGGCQPPFGSSFPQGKWNTAPVRAVAAGAWNTRFEPCGAWHFQSRMAKRESIGNKPHRIAHRRGRICVRVRLGRTALQVIINVWRAASARHKNPLMPRHGAFRLCVVYRLRAAHAPLTPGNTTAPYQCGSARASFTRCAAGRLSATACPLFALACALLFRIIAFLPL